MVGTTPEGSFGNVVKTMEKVRLLARRLAPGEVLMNN